MANFADANLHKKHEFWLVDHKKLMIENKVMNHKNKTSLSTTV